MKRRKPAVRLQDILDNIINIQNFLKGKSLENFKTDTFLRFAVERALEIISEASRHIAESDKARYPQIPWYEIKAVGNILRHEYQSVDPEIIWDTATQDLEPLRHAIETMKRELAK